MSDTAAPPAAPFELRDGSRVRIRPAQPSDRELLLRGFERLSPESRYRRFLAPTPELTGEMVRELTDIDHHDREAIVALDERSGEGLGVARYVRNADRPAVAEVAVTVIDDWQGRGLGTLLLELLSARAREEGIRCFSALILAANEEIMDLLTRLDHLHVVERGLGTVEVEAEIPDLGVPPEIKRLLRIAARRDLLLPVGAESPAAPRLPGA